MAFIRIFSLILATVAGTGSAIADRSPFDDLTLDASVHATNEEPFVPHVGVGPFGSYLTMTIPYLPISELFTQIQVASGQPLISRGEAHITVVTPVEFDQKLKSHISIAAINDLATRVNVQALPLSIVCLGQGKVTSADADLYTYFVVVESLGLLDLRRAIHQAFVEAGGDPAAFDPELFYPHITVGFTARDLHLEDGVVKDRSSCVGDL